jgi:hypothetical protein
MMGEAVIEITRMCAAGDAVNRGAQHASLRLMSTIPLLAKAARNGAPPLYSASHPRADKGVRPYTSFTHSP